MKNVSYYDVAERREAKRLSRERDIALVHSGSVSASDMNARNNFFSVLDRSKASISVRRARVKLDLD
jgi:hypothetical protein